MTEIGSTGRNGGSLVQNTRRNRKKVSRDQEITFSSDSYTYITFLPLLISTKIATVGQAENWNQRNELMPVDVTYDLRSSVSNKTALRIFSQTYSLQFHYKKSFIFRLFSLYFCIDPIQRSNVSLYHLINRRPCTIILNFPNIEISNTNFSFYITVIITGEVPV